MIIKLSNGTELTALGVMGEKRNIQGARRDILSFVFPVDTSLDELDAIFTDENCKSIAIADGDAEYIYSNYTIRVELKREPVQISAATDISDAVYENRVTVAMAQTTYQENQIAEMQASMNALLNGEV